MGKTLLYSVYAQYMEIVFKKLAICQLLPRSTIFFSAMEYNYNYVICQTAFIATNVTKHKMAPLCLNIANDKRSAPVDVQNVPTKANV